MVPPENRHLHPRSILTRAVRMAAAAAMMVGLATPLGAATMTFKNACAKGDILTIAAVGDLLFHKPLQVQGYRKNGAFRDFWSPVAGILRDADLTYGNLEGPVADGVKRGGSAAEDPGRRLDRVVYDGFPTFNAHPSVLDDIVADGFDVLSTANNHALDRGPLGIDRTIANLTRRGIAFTGTRARTAMSEPWSTITRKNGFSIAWLACTEAINGIGDKHAQVLKCHAQRKVVMAEIARLAARRDIDAVLVTPHWGEENKHVPLGGQKAFARAAVKAGALAVIGTHPHVVQPWEQVTAGSRQGLVIYSTGNFISDQRFVMQRAGLIAIIRLVRPKGRKARLSGAGFVPLWVDMKNLYQRASYGHRVHANIRPVRSREALAETLRILPAGNRLSAARWRDVPRGCGADPSPEPLPDLSSRPAAQDPGTGDSLR